MRRSRILGLKIPPTLLRNVVGLSWKFVTNLFMLVVVSVVDDMDSSIRIEDEGVYMMSCKYGNLLLLESNYVWEVSCFTGSYISLTSYLFAFAC